jgi:pyruvate dehydrogenase E2 component (dihydrolipoamide acetyltransferase)
VITRRDVEAAAGGSRARTAWVAPQPAAAAAPIRAGDSIPVQGVRARIAEHMTRSRAEIPDASCGVWADCSRLLELRHTLRATATARASTDVLTPFALMLRLVVAALQSRPILNATFDAERETIEVHDSIHLGIGTDTPRGLAVPVVRDAEWLSTLGLATEVRRLTVGVRAGTLPPTDLVGSTFTVSNFGVFGLDDGTPVINHPEVAILGIGAIRERPVVIDGAVVPRRTAHLTCSFDHRACDGADAGAFLAHLKDLIEEPAQLLLDS